MSAPRRPFSPKWSRFHPTIRPATAIAPPRSRPADRGLGLTVERHKVPDALVRANGMISATNLIVRRRFGEGGPTIALNAHGDVVPPGEGWTRDPYGAEIVDGWMVRPRGRGVEVGLRHLRVCAAGAARSAAPRSTARSNCISPMTRRRAARSARGVFWSRASRKPDLAIGAGFSYAVVNAHNGCLHLEVEVARPLGARRHGRSPASTRSRRRTRSSPRSTAGAAGWRRGSRRSRASARRS